MSEELSVERNGILLGMDLFFASKIQGTAKAFDSKIVTVTGVSQLFEKLKVGKYKYLLIDLEAYNGELEFIKEMKAGHSEIKVIAFGSHVNTERLGSAAVNGADEVMPRSKFSGNLPTIIEAIFKK